MAWEAMEVSVCFDSIQSQLLALRMSRFDMLLRLSR
jgi:hypothetical protein